MADKSDFPDIPDEAWARVEQLIRINFGAQWVYIASSDKGLAELESTVREVPPEVRKVAG